MAKYSNTSPYFSTLQTETYLDLYTPRPITIDADDQSYTIERTYAYRPDLLAYDLYGTPRLWWVFAQRNPDQLEDPIYDFKPGVPGRPDRFIIGTVTKVDAESQSQPGALGYHVKVETDMPREKESAGAGNRKGKTIFVPYEMGMDYDERISPA